MLRPGGDDKWSESGFILRRVNRIQAWDLKRATKKMARMALSATETKGRGPGLSLRRENRCSVLAMFEMPRHQRRC